jgi:hypothetical protein
VFFSSDFRQYVINIIKYNYLVIPGRSPQELIPVISLPIWRNISIILHFKDIISHVVTARAKIYGNVCLLFVLFSFRRYFFLAIYLNEHCQQVKQQGRLNFFHFPHSTINNYWMRLSTIWRIIKPEVCRYQPKPKAEVDNGKLRAW